MSNQIDPFDEDDDVVEFTVPVDMQTMAWLIDIAEATNTPPAIVIALILRDVCVDDQAEHACERASRHSNLHH